MGRKDISDKQIVSVCYLSHCGLLLASPLVLLSAENPRKVALRAMERAHRRDLIEYGVSVGTAWPTAKGLKLLDPVTK